MGRYQNRGPRRREQGQPRQGRPFSWSPVFVALWLCVLCGHSEAAMFVVDRTDDPDPATAMACTAAANDCSLRGAIELANGDATPDMITFAQNGVYTLDPGRGQLTIGTDISIEGTGTDCSGAGTCIQADTNPPSTSGFRVFSITAGNVGLSDLTIRHGFGTPGGGVEIQENATVSLSECEINENLAGRGGGIFNSGSLTVTDCSLADNRALIGGGLYNNGTTDIDENSYVILNGALFGGGIANLGKITVNELGTAAGAGVMPGVTLRDTEVGGNRALVGGGIWNDAGTVLLLLQFFQIGVGTGSSAVEVGNANLLVTEESSVIENVAVIGGGIANTRLPVTQIDLPQSGGGSAPVSASVGSAETTVNESEVEGNGALLAGGIANDDIATQLLLILANELIGTLDVQPGVGAPAAAGALDPTAVDQVLAVLGSGAPHQFVQQTFEQQDLGPVVDALQQASPMFDLSLLSEATSQNPAPAAVEQHASLTLMNAQVEFNSALIGGGVVNTDQATVNGLPLSVAQEPGLVLESSISENNLLLMATDGSLPEPELGLVGGGIGFLCGGVLNVSSMTIDNTLVVENNAFAGGGICNWGVIPQGGFFQLFGSDQPEGQRPFSDADLTVTASVVAANVAYGFGGIWNDTNTILYAVIRVVVEVLGNFAQAPGTDGPALGIAPALADAVLRLQDDTIVVANSALLTGGLANTRFPFEALPFFGLAGGTASAAIADSGVFENEAGAFGGVQNDGSLLAAIAGFILDDVFSSPFPPPDFSSTDVTATQLHVTDSEIDGNWAAAIGGLGNLFATALLERSSINHNDLGLGESLYPFSFAGGIYNGSGSTVLDECTVDDNGADDGSATAAEYGGGIVNDGFGNALYDFVLFPQLSEDPGIEQGNSVPGPGTQVELTATTVSNNRALFTGAGLFNVGEPATANVTNSTFSGNVCDEDGGGIANLVLGTVNLSNVTVTDNTAGAGGDGDGGGVFEDSGNLTINVKNSIIAGNVDNGGDGNVHPDCSNPGGTIASFGYNLIGDETGCAGIFNQTGDQTGNSGSPIDPRLGPLADNGGPTFTHALCSGVAQPDASCTGVSPALDGVGAGACTDLDGADVTTDQRGFGRPQGPACDIGAYETTCGDGLLDGNEQCDTGNPGDDTDCCSDQCQLLGAETVCRPATDLCDAPDTCADQTDGLCPADEVLAAGTECREPANVCDPAEQCDGASKSCPADVPFLDSDGDGVCNGQEIPGDENDPSVTSFIPEGETDFKVRLELLANCGQIENFALLMEEDLPVQDPDFFYPCGLISFELPCVTADVKATFNGLDDLAGGGFVYRKFNPNTMQYFDMPVPVQLMGNMALFTLTDGGPEDTDGTANGRIVDPNGPGVSGIAPAPALSPLGLVFAVLSLLGVFVLAMRKRRRAGT